MRGRCRVEHAVDEEHGFLPSRVGVALGLASTASRARARARVLGSERGARSLCSEAVLCGDAAFAQGLRCAKLCRTSDVRARRQVSPRLRVAAPAFLVCYWTLVDTAPHCFWAKSVVITLRARIAAHSHAALCGQRAPPRLASLPAATAAPPHCAQLRRRRRTSHGLRRRRHQGQIPDLRRRRR
jgi:hypothetical protein